MARRSSVDLEKLLDREGPGINNIGVAGVVPFVGGAMATAGTIAGILDLDGLINLWNVTGTVLMGGSIAAIPETVPNPKYGASGEPERIPNKYDGISKVAAKAGAAFGVVWELEDRIFDNLSWQIVGDHLLTTVVGGVVGGVAGARGAQYLPSGDWYRAGAVGVGVLGGAAVGAWAGANIDVLINTIFQNANSGVNSMLPGVSNIPLEWSTGGNASYITKAGMLLGGLGGAAVGAMTGSGNKIMRASVGAGLGVVAGLGTAFGLDQVGEYLKTTGVAAPNLGDLGTLMQTSAMAGYQNLFSFAGAAGAVIGYNIGRATDYISNRPTVKALGRATGTVAGSFAAAAAFENPGIVPTQIQDSVTYLETWIGETWEKSKNSLVSFARDTNDWKDNARLIYNAAGGLAGAALGYVLGPDNHKVKAAVAGAIGGMFGVSMTGDYVVASIDSAMASSGSSTTSQPWTWTDALKSYPLAAAAGAVTLPTLAYQSIASAGSALKATALGVTLAAAGAGVGLGFQYLAQNSPF